MTATNNRPTPDPTNRELQVRPPVDLVRADDHLIMTVSLPGFKPSDFRMSLVGDRQVYIEGTAQYRHPVPRESLALAERPYGPFQRTVHLPFPVQAQGVRVHLVDGVLTASLPIRRQVLPLQWVAREGER